MFGFDIGFGDEEIITTTVVEEDCYNPGFQEVVTTTVVEENFNPFP